MSYDTSDFAEGISFLLNHHKQLVLSPLDEKYSLENVAKQYMKLYESLVC